MNFSLRIFFLMLSAQTFVYSAQRPPSPLSENPSPRGAKTSSPRKTEQSAPAMMAFKRNDTCEVIYGAHTGKKVSILGSCIAHWHVPSIRTFAINDQPGMLVRAEVVAYCNSFGITATTIKDLQDKVRKSKEPKLDEPLYIAELVAHSVFEDPRVCLHPSWLKKVEK